jgi:hypothetical protein
MRGRRLLLVVAVLMGLTALAASIVPRDGTPPAPRAPAPGTSPARTPTKREPPGGGKVTTVKAVFSTIERTRAPKRVVADVGDLVDVRVRGNVVDSVSVDGLTDVVPIDPQSPAQLQLLADEPGVYPVSLLQAERVIGRLDIRPRPAPGDEAPLQRRDRQRSGR